MGKPYKGKMAGHALAYGSIPVYRNYPDHAVCECGANSQLFRTVRERKVWHRQHKADVIDQPVGALDAENSRLRAVLTQIAYCKEHPQCTAARAARAALAKTEPKP